MRRLAAWGLYASAAAAAGAGAADPAPPAAPPKPWYSKLTPGKAPDPAPPGPSFADAAPRTRAVGPLDPAALLEAVRAENAALDRRLEVCHRLREVALANNDDALEREAVALEQRATALHELRLARLGVKSPAARKPSPAPVASVPAAPAPFREVKQ